jgi:hypothetical protein
LFAKLSGLFSLGSNGSRSAFERVAVGVRTEFDLGFCRVPTVVRPVFEFAFRALAALAALRAPLRRFGAGRIV